MRSEPIRSWARPFAVSDDVQAVSYLSDSGYTFTLALNVGTGRMVGFASNEQGWYPVEGTFEVVD